MKRKTTILFDLDGTLVNTEEGITKCVRHALAHFGMQETDRKKLQRFIGPPLEDSFRREYGFGAEQAKKATAVFRERYETLGVQECELFPGVEEALKAFRAHGFSLSVASSKQEPACRQILERFGIAQYFDTICGGRKEENISTKIQVLREAFLRLGIQELEEVALIGDTRYDALGAREAGIDCIGVSYGFEQDFGEMEQAGVVGIYDSLQEILDVLVQIATV